MGTQKFYVVWIGHRTGIFDTWPACAEQVKGFAGAQYKSFKTLEAAKAAYSHPYEECVTKEDAIERPCITTAKIKPNMNSLSVDAACSGVPGPLEYRGVWTATGEEVFRQGPFADGTNNIGEFLAIVHGLAWLKQRHLSLAVYSDSRTALSWVRQRRCLTKHARSAQNTVLFNLVERAETWLRNNTFDNPLLKWDTDAWGEIPADFGRKRKE